MEKAEVGEKIRVELIYPLPHEQILYVFELAAGSRLRDGILASGVLERYPELELEALEAGIFGKQEALDTVLRARDRIEIYRPLIADPKAVRKQRAAEGRRMKKGDG
ncbi:MAG: RnfH family protein [Thiothrix sp.]|nr:RnfH family protein [Thiothrix sp.]HPQ94853.1 RnfH family protein [Thiolinea sp.]